MIPSTMFKHRCHAEFVKKMFDRFNDTSLVNMKILYEVLSIETPR